MAGPEFFLNIDGKFLFICWREPTGCKNSENLKLLKTIKFHNQLQTKISEPNFGTLPQNTDPNLQQQPTHIQTLSEDSAAKIISLGKTCFLLGCGYCFLLRVTDSVVNEKEVVYDAYRLYYVSCLSFYLYPTYTKNPKMDAGRDFPPIVRGRTLVLPPPVPDVNLRLILGKIRMHTAIGVFRSVSTVGGGISLNNNCRFPSWH